MREFMDNKDRSCSMDFRCVTPEHVYMMWNRRVPFKEIDPMIKVLSTKLRKDEFILI